MYFLSFFSIQHIAASIGSKHCVTLLLEYGGDPNIKGMMWCISRKQKHKVMFPRIACITSNKISILFDADCEENVPLWEAIIGKHESLIKLLLENGAEISAGSVGHYACTAVEQNSLELLKDIVRYGGDVTLPKSDGTTALHTAISDGNAEIVNFLLEQGADPDERDSYGWSPRALAEHQGHEEIIELFQNKSGVKKPTTAPQPNDPHQPRLVKFHSEPTIPPYVRDGRPNSQTQWFDDTRIRRVNNFPNSLFGIVSAANNGESITYFLSIP